MTKQIPVPVKKKNAVGVQRKISNINDELPSVPVVRASTNQPAEAKGLAETLLFSYSLRRSIHDGLGLGLGFVVSSVVERSKTFDL